MKLSKLKPLLITTLVTCVFEHLIVFSKVEVGCDGMPRGVPRVGPQRDGT